MSYSINEMRRLGKLLTETDPRTDEYLILLRSIEVFSNAMTDLDLYMNLEERSVDESNSNAEEMAEVPISKPHLVEPEPYEEESATAPFETENTEENEYTLADIRKALTEAKRNGENVVEFIKSYGVDNVTAIPASKYPEIMGKLGKR